MIAVIGPNEATDDERAVAFEVGRRVGASGHALVCGGRDGVMAAACEGARAVGGTTIGILPGYDPAAANPWVEHAVCTGMGHARNAIVVASGQAVIAISGGFGTLSEVGLALALGKPVIAVESWGLEPERIERFGGAPSWMTARSAEEAVKLALDAIGKRDRDQH